MEEIFENFKLYFPSASKEVVAYKSYGDFEIVVYYEDGGVGIYDDVEHSLRNLKRNGNDIAEESWRREFGNRLRRRMFTHGYTQTELASEIGVSQVMLSNYMTGRSMPGLYTVSKIAKVLGCSVNDLIYS